MEQRRRKVIKEYAPAYYDAETGELLTELSPQEKQQADDEFDRQSGVRFCKVFAALSKVMGLKLHKCTFVLLIHIITSMSFGNKFYYRRNSIAKSTGLNPAAVTLAFQELVKCGFCVPISEGKLCLVNPVYAFRGINPLPIQQQFEKLQKKFSYQKVKTNPEMIPSDDSKVKTNSETTPLADSIRTAVTLSKRCGENKKVKILGYLLNRADDNHVIFRQVNQMVDDLKISKATIIPMLNLLELEGYISRPYRGVVNILKFQELEKYLHQSRDEQ